MSGSSGEQDRKNQELDALNVAALRSQDDEGEIPWKDLPELTSDERAALDSLGPDLVEQLLAGGWIVRGLKRALRQRDKAAIHDSISDLVRELGGKARTLIQDKLPGVLEITDFQTVLSRSLKRACDRIDDYDPSMHSLDVWFLRIVCYEALGTLRGNISNQKDTLLQTED